MKETLKAAMTITKTQKAIKVVKQRTEMEHKLQNHVKQNLSNFRNKTGPEKPPVTDKKQDVAKAFKSLAEPVQNRKQEKSPF